MSSYEVIEEFEEELFHDVPPSPLPHSAWVEQLIGTADSIRNWQAHIDLRQALVEHQWSTLGMK